jgi:gliding motility-associated-like protein
VLISSFYSAQNQATKWYFGNLAGLDFMTNPPTVLTNGSLTTSEGCASIADAAGNLLFYTDGISIWNSSHTVMPNGSGMNGHSSTTQSAIIVKRPGNATQYYVFTLGVSGIGALNYSEVDMSLAAGAGSVISKNNQLATPCSEKLTAVRHCNGVDTWVVSHASSSRDFQAFHVSATGVNTSAVISTIGSNYTGSAFCGNMKASPNGRKLGVAIQAPVHAFELFDFDISTGVVSNSLSLGTFSNAYGCEFSPDGTKFYGSREYGTGANTLFQWDLCAGSPTAIIASQFTIGTLSQICGMQLAPNGKLYIARWGSTLAVVNNPNVYGTGCNYVHNGQSVAPRSCCFNLPNFTPGLFRPPPPPFTHTVSNSFGCQTASFTASPAVNTFSLNNCVASGFSLTGVTWNFGDPGSGSNNTTTATNPAHAFTYLGNFTVSLILHYSCGGGTDTIRQTVNINQPCISVSSTSITCASLGSATVAATGGIGPFSYTWMPTSQASSVANGLAPGSYTITVFDFGNNFTYTANVVFTSLIPLTGNISHAGSVTCNGASTATGSVTNLAGGSGNQFYLWTNGNTTLNTQYVSALSAGLWSVTVTDALTGCQINDIFLITQPFAQAISITASSPTACAGGSITFTGQSSGGTPGYTFSWTPGPQLATHTVSEASGGSYIYTLTSTDANSCQATQTVAVNFVSNPLIVVSNVSICPMQTGTLSAGGATSYTWSTAATSSTISDSPLNTTGYTVTGEALGCTSVATASIILKPVPSPLVSSNSPRCNGQSINLYGGGGLGYSWSGPQSFTSASQNPVLNAATPFSSGVYLVTVTAANGCTAAASSSVTVHPTPTVSAAASTVCVNGTLNLYAASFPGATFSWSGPAGYTSNQQNPSVQGPSTGYTGNYFVVATSAVGCTNAAVAHGSVVPLPVVSFTTNSPRCMGEDLVLNAGGTTGALVYSWTGPNGFISSSVTNTIMAAGTVAAGIYNLVVTTGPCTAGYSQPVTVHPLPNPVVSYNGPVCETKSMTVMVSTPPNETIVAYTWQAPAGLSSPNNSISVTTASFVHSGVYSATVTDMHGCRASASGSIMVLQNPTVSAASATVCLHQPATLTAQGAKDYFWIGPGLTVMNFANAVIGSANSVTDVGYLVIGTAPNGCTAMATASVSTWALPSPSIGLLPGNKICLNETISLFGLGAKSYEWHGPQSIFHGGETFGFTATSLIYAGTYTLVGIDKNNCRGKTTTEIAVIALPEVGLTGTAMEGCVPFCSDFRPMVFSSLVTASWLVNGKATGTGSFSSCFNKEGSHTIKGFFTDTLNKCKSQATFTVFAHGPPAADFSWLPERPVEKEGAVIFTNRSDGERQSSWEWYFMRDGVSGKGESQQHLFEEAGLYPVAMIVKNTWGCTDTVVKVIEVLPDFSVYVPNAFTPNDDGTNDVFLPVTRGVRDYRLMIFNRWGETIFDSTDPLRPWDGTFAGQFCKEDVYTWQLFVFSHSGVRKDQRGSVTLYR